MQAPNMDQMRRNPQQAMQNMRKNMDPKMIQQMGGMDNIMKMGQQMGLGKGGMPGAGGGMPDMGSIMKMMQGMGMAPGGGGGPPGGGMGGMDMGAMMQ